ncbi:MAG: ribonuclease E activity regulator RraA [Pseudomonadales bacterium]
MKAPEFLLPDLCDAFGDELEIAQPIFRHFGGSSVFCGPIRTIACFEDNSLVAERVREPGEGRVLVIDGGGSLRCALVGDNLARLAVESGWSGMVVNGCVRDVDALARMPIGILALAAHPLRSVKRGLGRRDEKVAFAGVAFSPDLWVYADVNGLAVASRALPGVGGD